MVHIAHQNVRLKTKDTTNFVCSVFETTVTALLAAVAVVLLPIVILLESDIRDPYE